MRRAIASDCERGSISRMTISARYRSCARGRLSNDERQSPRMSYCSHSVASGGTRRSGADLTECGAKPTLLDMGVTPSLTLPIAVHGVNRGIGSLPPPIIAVHGGPHGGGNLDAPPFQDCMISLIWEDQAISRIDGWGLASYPRL